MKAGIITFHGSHNHGSVLQAYATQRAVESLGVENEIINFRMESQKRYYSLYQKGFGLKLFCQDLLMIPFHEKRKIRAEKFESFISQMKLSGPEMKNREELNSIANRYDIYISGSDQIWSNRIPELARSPEDFTGVYFFDFVKNTKPRIAYASSVGEITYNELIGKKRLLEKYSHISTREKYGVDLLKKVVDKNIDLVLDPTFLLNKSEWEEIINKKRLIKEPYIFLYTLKGFKHGTKWGKALGKFSRDSGLKVVAVSPFFPIIGRNVHNVMDAGPLDFLNLIANAELVFTDSFHGTAFSINLNKPFYSYIGKNSGDNRKKGVLIQFGLESRSLERIEDILKISDYKLNYDNMLPRIDENRRKSMEWLSEALFN